MIGDIFKELGLRKNPKVTILSEFFDFERIKLKDSSGNWVHGIVIKGVK